MSYPSQDLLHQLLNYDPATGIFTWRNIVSSRTRVNVGDQAGTISEEGYLVIGINRCQYRAHRLAWIYMNGCLPRHQIDHKDKDKTNNKWSNLREATHSQNQMNKRTTRKTPGLKGTTFNPKRGWIAQIRKDKKTINLGVFKTTEQAHQRYLEAAASLFGEFASPE